MSAERRRGLVEPAHPGLPIVRQCELPGVIRSTFYREPAPETAANLTLTRLIDEQFLETPWHGSLSVPLLPAPRVLERAFIGQHNDRKRLP